MAYIMIVASRQDREYIGVLANSLLNRGFDVWIDDIRVGYGDETWNPTVEALKKSAGVIVVMTPAGYQSEWVQRQVMVALNTGKPVLPLLLDGENWPLFFNFQYIDVREAKLPSEHFYRFLANITLPGKQKGQLVSYTEISSEVAQGKKEDSSKKLFISYRRDDSADVAGRIYDRLIAAFKKEAVFKDVDSIPLGVDFREHIGRFIQQSEMLLVIIGKSWASITDRAGQRRLDNPNDFVRIEIEMAFNNNIPIIPVLVNDATMPDESELPETLKKLCYLNAATVRRDPDFHRDMDYVITSIQNYSRR